MQGRRPQKHSLPTWYVQGSPARPVSPSFSRGGARNVTGLPTLFSLAPRLSSANHRLNSISVSTLNIVASLRIGYCVFSHLASIFLFFHAGKAPSLFFICPVLR